MRFNAAFAALAALWQKVDDSQPKSEFDYLIALHDIGTRLPYVLCLCSLFICCMHPALLREGLFTIARRAVSRQLIIRY